MIKTKEFILVENNKAQVKGSVSIPTRAFSNPNTNAGGVFNTVQLLDIIVTPLSQWTDSVAAILTVDYSGLSSPFTFNVRTLAVGESHSVLGGNSGVLQQPDIPSNRSAQLFGYVDATATDGNVGATKITFVYSEPDSDAVVAY